MVGMEPEHEESDAERIARHGIRHNTRLAEEVARKRAALEAEYRSKRLEIAAVLHAAEVYRDGDSQESLAIRRADLLMAANASAPIPAGAIP